jgi:hypothetical protein
MKNIIKFCAGLSVLGLTACCSTNECAEPVRETVVQEAVVQEEVIMMHPESAVHPEHHKKHHRTHHHATHKAAHDCDHPAHKSAPHKNKAVQDMQNQMQNSPAPTQGATESK